MTDSVDVVVIGAGVVGLACARALALAGRDVLVLERHSLIGSETSSRNSEVIHAGIYYPTGSLKAQLCVEGKARLYAYCAERGVPHRRCGKIIVATAEEQLGTLRDYQVHAARNGAGDLAWLDRDAIRALEPAVSAIAGIHSPTTGIIDSHAYMLALQGDLEAAGGLVVLNANVQELRRDEGGIRVVTDALALHARLVVNAAGLTAPILARQLDVAAPVGRYARGRYYGYSGPAPFSRLVYPVAESAGLGVHVTVDLAGQIRFGPDVEWIDAIDYTFDDTPRDAFHAAIARYFPAVERERLMPGYTGIRPKISPAGAPAADFRIDASSAHGVPGLVNLLGIESPGLTASLAIADAVVQRVRADRC
ncbi:MAG: NAD(P)/FAD-dependent oxidoreductase [Gammaproteobacteria bacterium]